MLLYYSCALISLKKKKKCWALMSVSDKVFKVTYLISQMPFNKRDKRVPCGNVPEERAVRNVLLEPA